MNKFYRSLKNLALVTLVLAPIPACVMLGSDTATAAEKGFAPSYLGAGVGVVNGAGETESEVGLMGAYRNEGIDAPVSVRGAVYPFNGLEVSVGLTYDVGVAKNTNLFAGGGLYVANGDLHPSVGVGAEYLFEKYNTVVFASYDRVFVEDEGVNFGKFGVGYQF